MNGSDTFASHRYADKNAFDSFLSDRLAGQDSKFMKQYQEMQNSQTSITPEEAELFGYQSLKPYPDTTHLSEPPMPPQRRTIDALGLISIIIQRQITNVLKY